MPVQQQTPYIRSLTNLRRTQRPDKHMGKSGKKGGRPGDVRAFPLVPVHDVNDDKTIEEMQMQIGAKDNSENQNHVNETIQNVIDEGVQWSEANPNASSEPTLPPSTLPASTLPSSSRHASTLPSAIPASTNPNATSSTLPSSSS